MNNCAINDPSLLRPLLQDGFPSGREYQGQFIQALRCPHCAYIRFPSPSGELLDDYYHNHYPATSASWYNVESDYAAWKVSSRAGRIVQWMRRFGVPPGSVVHEFGCAFGGTVHELNRLGYAASGTELNSTAVEQGRARGNTAIFAEDAIGYLRRTGTRPKVVYSYHAIEHFVDPFSFLTELRSVIDPDGLLILVAPSAAAKFALVYGHMRYVWFGYPEHLHLFSPGSAPSLAESTGYSLLHVESAEYSIEPEATARALLQSTPAAHWVSLGDASLTGPELIMVMTPSERVLTPRLQAVCRETLLKCENFANCERHALDACEQMTSNPWPVGS